MIHSAEMEALAVQEVNKLISESLADSITISDMGIDDKGNIQYKDNGGNWTTVILSSPTVSHCFDSNELREYDRKIKEYIDEKIDEKLNLFNESNKYKIMTGEE